jgi:hypothetical protein
MMVLPDISSDLWSPNAVEMCSVKNGAIITSSRGAGPYPKAKHRIEKSGVLTRLVGKSNKT